jgi:glycosyltransferase involved in cell wall biosynthesis
MRVSVIIANRNDVAILGVTLRSAIEELSAVPGGGEVVICDNSDAEHRPAVESIIPRRYLGREVRIYYQDYACLFTAREQAARQARGKYIFCVDAHMIFGRDSIVRAVEFMDRRAGQPVGFGSIPINWLCQHEGAARHDMRHLHGTWGHLYEHERRISWKGIPWICNRDWFLDSLGAYGCLSANKMSWGGGDVYLGLKTWLLGFENWAIPSRPVIHIGPLPPAARQFYKYRTYQGSGQYFATLGFLVAFYALGVEPAFFERPEISSFLEQRVGKNFREHLPLACELAAADHQKIAGAAVMSYAELAKTRPWDAIGQNKPKEIF